MFLLCVLIAGGSSMLATTYVKVTSATDLVNGDVYIIATSSVVAISFSSNVLNTTDSGFTESDGVITTSSATPMEFTLGIKNSNYTLKNGDYYLGYANSSTATNLRLNQTANSSLQEQWTIFFRCYIWLYYRKCTFVWEIYRSRW